LLNDVQQNSLNTIGLSKISPEQVEVVSHKAEKFYKTFFGDNGKELVASVGKIETDDKPF
jgi:hypothetical protein